MFSYLRVLKYIGITGLISACAAPYVSPTDGAAATINFISTTSVHAGEVYFYDNENCDNPKDVGPIGYETIQLGPKIDALISGKSRMPQFSTALPANRDAIITFINAYAGAMGGSFCATTIKFKPMDSTTYNVTLDGDFNRCSAQVTRIDSDGSSHREPTAQRASKQCRK